jgi:hypothetical protein
MVRATRVIALPTEGQSAGRSRRLLVFDHRSVRSSLVGTVAWPEQIPFGGAICSAADPAVLAYGDGDRCEEDYAAP